MWLGVGRRPGGGGWGLGGALEREGGGIGGLGAVEELEALKRRERGKERLSKGGGGGGGEE